MDNCWSCKFFAPVNREDLVDTAQGRCLRLPPTPKAETEGDFMFWVGVWPLVYRVNWCGEYKWDGHS